QSTKSSLDFSNCNSGNGKVNGFLLFYPCLNIRIGIFAHQFGNNIRVQDNHQPNSGCLRLDPLEGSSMSAPPCLPKCLLAVAIISISDILSSSEAFCRI